MWTTNEAIAIYIFLGVVAACVISWLVLRKTVRTRLRTEKAIREDPDINEWLIVFNWSNKVLYVPAFVASLAAGITLLIGKAVVPDAQIAPFVGGLWLAVFFLNFLIEEFEISIKVLLIGALFFGLLLLWLHLLGWVRPFFRLFRSLSLEMNPTAYFLIFFIGTFTILLSWVKGLFYYVAVTPNYMNVQEGPTESGEHFSREDYNSRIDTGDFLERLMGFGRILIIFKDQKRPPLVLLVWRIKGRADKLEAIRGTISVEQHIRSGYPGGNHMV